MNNRGMLLLLFILLDSILVNSTQNNTITIDLGKYRKPINLSIDETYTLNGDYYLVERETEFRNVNFNNYSSAFYSFNDTEQVFRDYKQFDEEGNEIQSKRKAYLEHEIVSNTRLWIVKFPIIDIKNSSYQKTKETYGMSYKSRVTTEKSFWFPFDRYSFNLTSNNREVTFDYDLTLIVPNSYSVTYPSDLNGSAIEGYFVDEQSTNVTATGKANESSPIKVIFITCLSEYRPFFSNSLNNKKIITFPTVIMPSEKEDPCPGPVRLIRVHVMLERDAFLKNLFIGSIIVYLFFIFLSFLKPEHFKEFFAAGLAIYLAIEVYLLSLEGKPQIITIWDLTIVLVLFCLIIGLLKIKKGRKKEPKPKKNKKGKKAVNRNNKPNKEQ
jgi:hypothetical protein